MMLSALVKLAPLLPLDQSPGQDLREAMNSGEIEDIHPSASQFTRYFDEDPGMAPIMVNLLRYENRSEYDKYGRAAVRHVLQLGGEILWIGAFARENGAKPWDSLAVMKYPSRAAFGEMIGRAHYQAANEHRRRGLSSTELLVCQPQ